PSGTPPRYLLTGAEVRAVGALKDIFDSTASFELWSTNPAARQTLTGTEQIERLRGGIVDSNFFDVLGVQTAIGRTFDRADGPNVIVIGNGLWSRRFGADPEIVGRMLELDGVPKTVIGVLPKDVRFTYPQETDF